jgi:membrane-associated protease RseP (regulator of RpoE activity)
MSKNYILLSSLFLLGVAAGAAVMYERGGGDSRDEAQEIPSQPEQAAAESAHPMAGAFAVSRLSDSERIEVIEEQLGVLTQRIEELERGSAADDEDVNPGTVVIDGQSNVDTPVSRLNPAVTASNLINAGVEQDLAADIVRRANEIDLKLLELRDRASREGYFGTDRYAREVAALREQSPSLRDEIGDDRYDSYLFATRQNNRVRAVSVMMGSPAELAGMQDGDMILSYDNTRMFNWNELQAATALGERGEYVNVAVLRNGQLHNLWIPRGPLGIRLGTVRVKPRE